MLYQRATALLILTLVAAFSRFTDALLSVCTVALIATFYLYVLIHRTTAVRQTRLRVRAWFATELADPCAPAVTARFAITPFSPLSNFATTKDNEHNSNCTKVALTQMKCFNI